MLPQLRRRAPRPASGGAVDGAIFVGSPSPAFLQPRRVACRAGPQSPSSSSSSTSSTSSSAAAPGLLPEPWTGSPEQVEALEALRARMAVGEIGCPEDESLLRWYLRDRYFDPDEAAAKLTSMLAWRRAER